MSDAPPATPPGGFVVAIVAECRPVAIAFRSYSADFDPADVLKGSRGRYTPFDENAADRAVWDLGCQMTTAWELLRDDGYQGPGEWAAVVIPREQEGP